jgi:hypothetical protein
VLGLRLRLSVSQRDDAVLSGVVLQALSKFSATFRNSVGTRRRLTVRELLCAYLLAELERALAGLIPVLTSALVATQGTVSPYGTAAHLVAVGTVRNSIGYQVCCPAGMSQRC